MRVSNVEGITLISESLNQNRHRGQLDLPPDFDSKRFACRWAKKGVDVERAQQVSSIRGTSYQAAGWVIWKNDKGQPHQRALRTGIYILMVRPLQMQKAILAIHGNTSRKRMEREATNETVAGENLQDSGMLGAKVLDRIPGLGRENEEEPVSGIQFNQIDEDAPRKSTVARASSRAKAVK